MGASRNGGRSDAADSGKFSVRLGDLREKVTADAERLRITPSAVLRQIVELHYRRQEDKRVFERLSEYLQQMTEDIHKIRRDTKGVPQGVTRVEEAMRAFHEEFRASLVGDDDE